MLCFGFFLFVFYLYLIMALTVFKDNEKLSVEVSKCLFDKKDKRFKMENVKQNAWESIAKEVGLDSGKIAEKLWDNLKLLSKRKSKLRS